MISETEARAQADQDLTYHPAVDDAGSTTLEDVLKDAAYGRSRASKKKKVGTYLLGKTLGEGAFAKVRVALHLITKEKVAMKIVNKKAIGKKSDYWRKNMRREGNLLQRLAHPHIVHLYEVMETDNHYYLVTELVNGRDFTQHLADKKVLQEEEAKVYLRQIVSAVDHMHRSGVVHRDLKVDNILLDSDMNIKIIDFGLCCNWDGLSLLRTQCGSPAYAAPEIFSRKHYGPGVDIWSIGVSLYTMLIGTLPFLVDQKPNLTRLHAAILKGVKPPCHLSADCQDLIKRLLEPEASERIAMADLLTHPWLNKDQPEIPIVDTQVPLTNSDLDSHVVRYMVKHMSLNEMSLKTAIMHHKPSFYYATYHLLVIRKEKGLGLPDAEREFAHLGKAETSRNKIDSAKIFMAIKEYKEGKTEIVNDPILEEEEVEEGADTKSTSCSSSDDKDTDTTGSTFLSSEVSTPLHSSSPVDGESDARPKSRGSVSRGSSGRSITPRTVYKECLRQLKGQKSGTADKQNKGILKSNKKQNIQDTESKSPRTRRTSTSGSEKLGKEGELEKCGEKATRPRGNSVPTPDAIASVSGLGMNGARVASRSSLDDERIVWNKLKNDRSIKDMIATTRFHSKKDKTVPQGVIPARTKRLGSDPSIRTHAKAVLQSSPRSGSPPPVPPNSAMGNYRVLPPVNRSNSEEGYSHSSPRSRDIAGSYSSERDQLHLRKPLPALAAGMSASGKEAPLTGNTMLDNSKDIIQSRGTFVHPLDKFGRQVPFSHPKMEVGRTRNIPKLGHLRPTDHEQVVAGKSSSNSFAVPVVGTSPSTSPKREIAPLGHGTKL